MLVAFNSNFNILRGQPRNGKGTKHDDIHNNNNNKEEEEEDKDKDKDKTHLPYLTIPEHEYPYQIDRKSHQATQDTHPHSMPRNI